MKKILLVITFLVGLGGIAALNSAYGQNTMTATKNTHTNADTSYHTLKVVGSYGVVTIQLNGVKTSGTVAGTAVVQVSLDGTNYYTLTDSTGQFVGTYTIGNTTGTQTNMWTFDAAKYSYYRVRVYTTGTQVSSWSASLLNRK